MAQQYAVNEVFYSLQGEGHLAGTPMVFLRFAGCNLRCVKETHGFDCDTEFVASRKLSLDELCHMVTSADNGACKRVLLTGGEPLLQVDDALCFRLRDLGYRLFLETNGTLPVPIAERPAGCKYYYFSHVTVSPKAAEHAIRVAEADELRYVRTYGQPIPKPTCKTKHKFISPAFDGTALDAKTLAWCVQLVKENPEWRLSVQQHKLIGIL